MERFFCECESRDDFNLSKKKMMEQYNFMLLTLRLAYATDTIGCFSNDTIVSVFVK